MRLFIGVAPNRDAREALAASIRAVRQTLGDLDQALRWVPADNLHVTLHFLGEVRDDGLENLRAALRPPLGVEPFDVRIGSFGRFPPRGPLSTLWVGFEAGGEGLSAVHRAIADRLTAMGLSVERRPFTAHVTIARARDRDRRRLRSLEWPRAGPERREGAERRDKARGGGAPRELEKVPPPVARWRVTHATLFSSTLSSGAPVYRSVLDVPLQ